MCICSVTKYTYVHTHNIMCVYVIYIHMDLYVHISGFFSLRSQIGGIRIFVASISFPFFSYFVLASVCLICLIVCLFVRQYHGRVVATELWYRMWPVVCMISGGGCMGYLHDCVSFELAVYYIELLLITTTIWKWVFGGNMRLFK